MSHIIKIELTITAHNINYPQKRQQWFLACIFRSGSFSAWRETRPQSPTTYCSYAGGHCITYTI